MKLLINTALLTVGLSAVAHASDDQNRDLASWEPTGNELVSACRSNERGNASETNLCYAYIHGALDGFDIGGIWALPPEGGYVHMLCVPDKVTNSELRKSGYALCRQPP